MEIIAEIFIQLFGWVFELLGELLLQAFGELIGRSITEPFRRPKPVHPALAALGYAIFGALAGGISLWLLPSLFIAADWLRALNLVVTPLSAGLMMERLGAWREKRNQATIRLDTFAYGFVFALAMALVRFNWGH